MADNNSSVKQPAKKRRYECKYQSSWQSDYSWIKTSDRGVGYAFCLVCCIHISISHGGKNDVAKHDKTSQHVELTNARKSSKKINSFFTNTKEETATEVTKAEVLWANFVAEHNLPFAIGDHFSKLVKVMFPKCDVAKKFSCGRMKTTMLLKNAIAPEVLNPVAQMCRDQPFSLMIDESTDAGAEKNLVILVRLFDAILGRAVTRFLDMPVCNIGTGAAIFDALDKSLSSFNIPWCNLVSFTSDNCNTMKGRNNSVFSRILEQQPAVLDMGCIAHLANLCCVAGVKQLPLPIDDFLVDIYYHFHHSAKRKEDYKEFQEFVEVEAAKIIKHCNTRWLSLEKCVKRTLQQWPALKSYFSSHEMCEKPGRIKRVAEYLNDPEMKLYFHFLDFILGPLNQFNTLFQSDKTLIGVLVPEMKMLMKKLLAKFVTMRVIKNAEEITDVEFKEPENWHSNDKIAIGLATRDYLDEVEDIIGNTSKARFFQSVKGFYVSVVEKMIKKFPFGDKTLEDLAFINPKEAIDKMDTDVLMRLGKRFNVIKTEQYDELEEECQDFQLMSKDEVPSFDEEETRPDQWWHQIMRMKTPRGIVRYPLLSKILQAILTIPNSNADSERAFSMMKKVHTSYRSQMNNETLCTLMAAKMNTDVECFNYSVDKELCKKAKSATWDYVKEHQ